MQDIRKKHLNSRSNYPVTREISPRGDDTTISHVGLSGTEQRRPRFTRSDDISLYREREIEKRGQEDEDYSQPRDRRKSWRKIKTLFFYFVIFACVFGTYYALTYVFDKATVTITPNYKDLTISATEVTLGDKGGIPFEIARAEVTKTKTLPKTTTTTVDKKASGLVTVYNNYSTSPQRLVKFTRFESTAKKIYKIQDSIVIPGKKGDTPGELSVKVVAESEGPGYNLDEDSFTIPGFKGKDQYTLIYGKTKSAITGGASGSKAIVALTDLNAAKDELAVKLRDAAKSELTAKKWGSKVPLLDSLVVSVDDNSKEILQGEADTYSAKGTASIATVEGSDLSKVLLGGDVNKSLSYSFLPGKDITLSLDKNTTLLASSTLSLIVAGNARIIWLTNYDSLKGTLSSKTKKEFASIITNDKTVSSALVSIFPPWKASFPAEKDSITVKEKLPDYKL